MIVCLFDIDGTLLASGGAGKAALETALAEDFGIALRSSIPYAGRTDRAIIRDLFKAHEIDHSQDNLDKIFAGYLRRLPHTLTHNQGRVLPGVVELLDRLRLHDQVKIGLLTGNVRSGAQVKLGHFKLFDYFAFGGFGDLHFERDDVAREALGQIHHHVGRHVQPEQIWVIGDTPLDVQCARAIGAKVVAVATGQHSTDELAPHRPDVLLADLTDARPLLQRWGI